MAEMSPQAQEQFKELHDLGMSAKNDGSHAEALDLFSYAADVAELAGDERKLLDVLSPLARALWTLGKYDKAALKLKQAVEIASRLELKDEIAMAVSNMGRLAAVETIKVVDFKEQAEALREEAVPNFRIAAEMLDNHGHLYYRYANATHGSVAAALAGERRLSYFLIREGRRVKDRISPQPYDQRTPAEINPAGLKQLKAAMFLIPLGNRTPVRADVARQELVR